MLNSRDPTDRGPSLVLTLSVKHEMGIPLAETEFFFFFFNREKNITENIFIKYLKLIT